MDPVLLSTATPVLVIVMDPLPIGCGVVAHAHVGCELLAPTTTKPYILRLWVEKVPGTAVPDHWAAPVIFAILLGAFAANANETCPLALAFINCTVHVAVAVSAPDRVMVHECCGGATAIDGLA